MLYLKRTILALCFFTILFFFYINSWRKFWSTSEINLISTSINSSQTFNNEFYIHYDSIFKYDRTSSMYDYYLYLLKNLVLNKEYNYKYNKSCPCIDIYSVISDSVINKPKIEYASIKFAWALSGKVSSEKCFDYFIKNLFFYIDDRKIKGIDSLSNYLYNKPLSNLNFKESEKIINYMKFGKVIDNITESTNSKKFLEKQDSNIVYN